MITWLKALFKGDNMEKIIKRLEFHEGCVLKPYLCPTGHKTIGIERKQSFIKLLSELFQNPKFWVWATILTVLAFGVSITDLKGLLE